MAAPPDVSAHCPRCGYDVRAVISTWEQSCPLIGTCSECGLEFDWARVLRPLKFVPLWCIEYEPRRRRIPLAALRTFVRSFMPWRFWSRLNMSHEVQPKRILAYIVLLLVPVFLLYLIFQASVGVYVRYQVAQDLEAELATYPAQITQLQARNPATDPSWQAYFQTLAPEDHQRELQQTQQDIQRWIARYQQLIANPPWVDHSYVEAVVEAVIFPLSGTSWGQIVYANQRAPYVAPVDLYEYVWRNATSSRWIPTKRNVLHVLLPGGYLLLVVAFGCVGLILLPVTMVLLPVSRRRAKVRWSHIARVAAYSAFIPATFLIVDGLLFVVAFFVPQTEGPVIAAMSVLAACQTLAAIIWWWMAIRHYMKMQHGLTIAVLLVVLVILLMGGGIYWWYQLFINPVVW